MNIELEGSCNIVLRDEYSIRAISFSQLLIPIIVFIIIIAVVSAIARSLKPRRKKEAVKK